MDNFITQRIAGQLAKVFEELREPVEILFFGQEEDCQFCEETRRLSEEVAAFSDLIGLQTYDLHADAETAARFGVDKAPALVLAANDDGQLTDYGVRFYGAPSGHEFTTLITDLLTISQRRTDLSAETLAFLEGLNSPLLLQVFVTPSCPYCPQAVVLAHQLAMESPLVQAEMIEATEFPDLARQFNVGGVPQTTINSGAGTIIGALPEVELLAEIQKAVENPA